MHLAAAIAAPAETTAEEFDLLDTLRIPLKIATAGVFGADTGADLRVVTARTCMSRTAGPFATPAKTTTEKLDGLAATGRPRTFAALGCALADAGFDLRLVTARRIVRLAASSHWRRTETAL